MPRRMLRAGTAVLASLAALAACGTSTTAPEHPPTTTSPASPTPTIPSQDRLKVSLVLSSTVVTAGTPLRATLTITNATGHNLHLPCSGGIVAGLDSPDLPFNPAWDLTCRPVTTVRPGSTRTNETILTEYSQCTQAATGSAPSPPCLPSAACHPTGSRCIAPALPAGTYTVKLVVLGGDAAYYDLPAPTEITVR